MEVKLTVLFATTVTVWARDGAVGWRYEPEGYGFYPR